jgi:putative transposase
MPVSREQLCAVFGRSRQGLWKHLRLAGACRKKEQAAIDIIRSTIRNRQPRTGTRKMLSEVNRQLLLQGESPIGRDHLFKLLRRHEMLVAPLRRWTRTTNSYHRFRTHKNLLKNTVQTGPHQAWVADITYLRQTKGFCYLFLLTDTYSRKIVGYHLSENLGVEGAIKALRMAIGQCPQPQGLIHHSDRGIQYCCDEYAAILEAQKITVSMTEQNHCYENAMAERVNETLKYDLLLGETFRSYKMAAMATKEAIKIYNEERWHQSIGYLTPALKHAA